MMLFAVGSLRGMWVYTILDGAEELQCFVPNFMLNTNLNRLSGMKSSHRRIDTYKSVYSVCILNLLGFYGC